MGVKIIEKVDKSIAIIEGDIDHHTAKDIREKIDIYAQGHIPKFLELDFSGVQFMDSSGIGLIMGRFKLMVSLNGKFKVVNVPKKLERMVKLGGLEKLGIFEDNNQKSANTVSRTSTYLRKKSQTPKNKNHQINF